MNATERARLAFRYGVTEAKPSPTEADLAAELYTVTFRWASTGTQLIFDVLAIGEAHAREMAELRMDIERRSHAGTTLTARKRSLETSGEAMAHQLNLETADEFACRQAAWQARQEPEPAEKINTLGGIEF